MSNQVGFGGGTSCATQLIDTGDVCDTSQEDKTRLPGTTKVSGKTGEKFLTVQIWDTIGCDDDNIVRLYNKNQCVYKDGRYYWSLEDNNVTEPGSDKWSTGRNTCEVLKGDAGTGGSTTLVSSDKTIDVASTATGFDIGVNIDGTSIVKDPTTGVLSVEFPDSTSDCGLYRGLALTTAGRNDALAVGPIVFDNPNKAHMADSVVTANSSGLDILRDGWYHINSEAKMFTRSSVSGSKDTWQIFNVTAAGGNVVVAHHQWVHDESSVNGGTFNGTRSFDRVLFLKAGDKLRAKVIDHVAGSVMKGVTIVASYQPEIACPKP